MDFEKLYKNLLKENQDYGVHLREGYNNIVYHNNFIRNGRNARDDSGENSWNLYYPSGGNFWQDYRGDDEFSGPEQDIPGSDGIGDTPYLIYGEDILTNDDTYPFMNPFDNILVGHAHGRLASGFVRDHTRIALDGYGQFGRLDPKPLLGSVAAVLRGDLP